MSPNQYDKARRFRDRHQQCGCFLMPNAWDIGSARMLEAAGFDALGTTSAGIAFSLGRPDNAFCPHEARVDRDTMLGRIEQIANAICTPLNADLEDGYGADPERVADTVTQAIAAGAVGGNIEDFTGNRREPLYDTALAVERIAAARAAIEHSTIPFVLVARTDNLLVHGVDAFAEAVTRANLFREAGADCLFVPGAAAAETIGRLVREIDGPLNVVVGLSGSALTLAQLQDLGVRRVSIGGSLARAVYYQIRQAAQQMKELGVFEFAQRQIPHGDLNHMFGD